MCAIMQRHAPQAPQAVSGFTAQAVRVLTGSEGAGRQ